MKSLILLVFVLIVSCSLEEKPICWRCTEKTVIIFRIGNTEVKDTSFTALSLDCGASEADIKAAEASKTKTTSQNMEGGVSKTTYVNYHCEPPAKIK